MAKSYNDLSRRGLIKLNQDFDENNEQALLQFLTESEEEYEDIRTIEVLTEKLDEAKSSFEESKSSLKQAAVSELDRVMNNLVGTMSQLITEIAKKED